MARYPYDPDYCIRPGETLRELLDQHGLTGDLGVTFVAKLAQLDRSVVEGILSGKTRITKNIAEHLAVGTSALSLSAQFWLNLERNYRTRLAAGHTDISDG